MAINIDDYMPSRDTSADTASGPRTRDVAEARKAAAAGILKSDTQVSYNGVEQWHLQQTADRSRVINGTTTDADKVMRDAGLTWTANRKELWLDAGTKVDGYVALTRSDNSHVLSVVKDAYQDVQTYDLFHSLDPLTSAGYATWETAGSLWGGKLVWGQVRFYWQGEVVPGDVIETFATVSNSFDTTRSVRWTLSSKRICCMNTMKISDADGRAIITARHKKGSVDRAMAEAKEFFTQIVEQSEKTLAMYRALAAHKLTDEERADYICSLIELPEAGDSPQSIAAHNRAQGVRDEIERLSMQGKGVEIEGVLGSAWGALNAVTEYVDHVKYEGKEQEKRDRGLMFGAGAELKEKALEKILAYV